MAENRGIRFEVDQITYDVEGPNGVRGTLHFGSRSLPDQYEQFTPEEFEELQKFIDRVARRIEKTARSEVAE